MNEKSNNDQLSPLMQQYYALKAQYPGSIMFYRVGDFYETFGEDAIEVSKVLGLVLTRKSSGGGNHVELAGIPYHAIDNYLPKLVAAGYKVAVCDQLEDPKQTRKIVKRGVTELITPGVSYHDALLSQKENNYLSAVYFEKDKGAVAFMDISTATFKVAQGSLDYIDVLLSDFAPKEILVQRGYTDGFRTKFGSKAYLTTLDDWAFVHRSAYRKLQDQFKTDSLKGFGIEDLPLAICAAGAVLFYLDLTEHHDISHIRSISRIDRESFMWIDRFTFRNLEIFNSLSGAEGVSLVQVIDKCTSPMGARLLRQWMSMPLKDAADINARLDAVEAFVTAGDVCPRVRGKVGEIGDMERIVAKAAAGKILPREVRQLGKGLSKIRDVIEECSKLPVVAGLIADLDPIETLSMAISRTILEEAASQIGKGDVISSDVNEELAQLRNILSHSKEILLDIQRREAERTGIASLKISYNNVFGYYLEVRNTYADKVPAEWIRKQTLVSSERYITPELKEYEEKILGAQEKINAIEAEIYGQLVAQIQSHIDTIQRNAQIVATIDCLSNFAFLAVSNDYCRPQIDGSYIIDIKQGRHPVIESMMQTGEKYIANDLFLDNESQQIIILTGPNMAGKSALLRQTALIVYLSHIGCYIPADSARIGVVDKLFTRVGATDNISRGESTFMVEMTETATILNNLSARSLVLLDEIGRGTSTYDGMSIAWAIVQYLHQNRYAAKTLFATHYHELNDLEKIYSRVKNYHISTKEVDGTIVFLRKLKQGGVASSFGIHVASIAGMPQQVIDDASSKLKSLEAEPDRPRVQAPVQLSLYQLDDPLLLEIKNIITATDINSISPLQAFDTLRVIKQKLGQ